MKFIWDKEKHASNLAKHGLDFALCGQMFDGAHLIFPDTRKHYGEERFTAYWRFKGRLLVTAFVFRGDDVRIISLRKANEREERRYAPQL